MTNPTTSKSLREKLRQTACARFSTVLGNGADAFHESDVHIDLMERTNHYKICQWDVLDPSQTAARLAMKAAAGSPSAASANMGEDVPLPRPRPHLKKDSSNLAQPGSRLYSRRAAEVLFSVRLRLYPRPRTCSVRSAAVKDCSLGAQPGRRKF